MEGIGAEVSQKIRSAIKAKLMEIGVYVDEELPDYVMVMVANKRSKVQMDEELQLFLGKHTSLFTTWLHQVLQKLQEVTVANLGGIKRKLSEDSKKKKKNKQDSEKKELKKKIKIEPEDDKKNCSKTKEGEKEKTDIANADFDSITSDQPSETIEPKRKEKSDSKTVVESISKSISKNNKKPAESPLNTEHERISNVEHRAARGKSRSISSQAEDLDDEDCINIRTDGELLDTAEEANTEETSKNPTGRKNSTESSDKEIGKKRKTLNKSPVRQESRSPVRQKSKSPVRHKSRSPVKQKNLSKSVDHSNSDRHYQKSTYKKQISPHESPPRSTDKILDARELLNRRKAAKQPENRSRTKSRERSVSPSHRRREDDRVYRDDRGGARRSVREDERDSSTCRVRNGKGDGRGVRDRDCSSSKRREDHSRRSDSDRMSSRRREPSDEPSPKRVMLEKPFKNKKDDRDFSRSSKVSGVSECRKMEMEAAGKKRESEESRKRGMVSHVVTRPQEPEDNVDTPVPSVVKITPRPRRPPSQQPSSTLIMKAISEANKSLASVPQRPDSIQRARKEPGFTRTLHQRERIPPETIAVSITNHFAVKNVEESEEDDKGLSSPCPDVTARNRSPPAKLEEVHSPESENFQNDVNSKEIQNKKDKEEAESQAQEIQEPVLELEELVPELEAFEEPVDEMSDPQFVVTLNGYDPDGIFSTSDMDAVEEGERDDWIKENVDEDPLLTSTPATESPRPKRERNTSPIIIMNTPAVNHSNLIEVKPKSSERCKYWPACRLADKCTFYHPTKPCKLFPACKFGDSCLYIHPQCKFNALCTRKDCVFSHTPVHTPLQPAAVPKAKALYAASAPQPCKFYPNCTNINCQFTHPARACRFGLYCTKKDCSFDHGQIAPVDKLKWTRVPTT